MSRASRMASTIGAYEAIEGRIEEAIPRDPRRFILRPAIGGEPVSCSLDPDGPTIPDNVWGRRAVVEGWVSRDGETGRPIAIDDVRNVTPMPDIEPGSIIRSLRGIAPAPPGSPPPEELIRQWRDEE